MDSHLQQNTKKRTLLHCSIVSSRSQDGGRFSLSSKMELVDRDGLRWYTAPVYRKRAQSHPEKTRCLRWLERMERSWAKSKTGV